MVRFCSFSTHGKGHTFHLLETNKEQIIESNTLKLPMVSVKVVDHDGGSHNSHIVKGYNLLPASPQQQLTVLKKEVYGPIIADNNLPNYLVMSVSQH